MSESTNGTDVATRSATTVALPSEVTDLFPALDAEAREEMTELLAENFTEGETLSIKNLTILTVPSGKSAAMWSWDDNGEEQSAKEVEGIVCGWTNGRNYWESDETTGEPPDCTSRDGKIGIGMYGVKSLDNPTGACEDCPMGQWTTVGDKRVPAPCKPQQRLLVLRPGETFPTVVQVPRTSMGDFKRYRADLLKNRKGLAQVVTRLGLVKVAGKDKGVPDYCTITFTRGDDLGRDAKRVALAVGQDFLPVLNAAPPITSPADTENVVPGEGGVGIGDAPVADDAPKEAAPA
jgi:hypothetical protein